MNVPAPSIRSFDHFEVDLENRIFRRGQRVVALQEKPFQLLEALLARPGRTVTREELRQELWGDGHHVDFDANLNAAARKLRRALGDSAQEPKWLVTVPGRGYRLTTSPRERPPTRPLGRPRDVRAAVAAAGLLTAVALVVLAVLGGGDAESSSPPQAVRLGIMPFELAPADGPPRGDLAPISDWLVAEMAGRWGEQLAVVGPRTTAAYTGKPFPDLARLASEYQLDYVLNARTVDDGERSGLLVELIRLSDGDHHWVHFFDDVGEWREVASAVRDGLAETLGLESGRV